MKLDADFWQNRYINKDTGWDIGSISRPLKEYFEQLSDTSMRILIPGCGKAHEAEFLHKAGFTNVFVADYAALALEEFAARVPDFPKDHLLQEDFFKLDGEYDLIVEQTFFCAIDRELRPEYVKKMFSLLAPGGILAGLLFNDFEQNEEPPYGGTETEYRKLFEPVFGHISMETSPNSIEPRKGRELFFICRKAKKNS